MHENVVQISDESDRQFFFFKFPNFAISLDAKISEAGPLAKLLLLKSETVAL